MTNLAQTARTIAANASFQAFANCYLREVDAGAWQAAASWQAATGARFERGETHVVKLELESQQQVIAVGVSFRSRVGRHTLTNVYRRKLFHREWQRIDGLTAQLLLIDALYAQRPEGEQRLELIARMIESQQVMAEYVEHQLEASHGARVCCSFIESEQALALGHWLHPTPKSRQGIHGWQHDHYAPELRGAFQLHFFAARRRFVEQASITGSLAEDISRKLAGDTAPVLGDGYCLLPTHPLQAQWLLHRGYVRRLLATGDLIDLGRLGPDFTPTSSVRTVYSEAAQLMVKLSIPVKITNSLRINLQTELGDSVWISQLLRVCGASQDFPQLRAVEDPAYITVALPDRDESGFEVIFRSSAFHRSGPAQRHPIVHSIAALTQDPLTNGERSLLAQAIHALARDQQVDHADAARRWFDAYWHCAVEAPIGVYDRYGVALEAHQQNVLLELAPSGLPLCCHYRDLQGVGISECFREHALALVPELAQQPKVFEPDDIVRNGFGYYLLFNQLYAVINRLALDGFADEGAWLSIVRRKLIELRPGVQTLGRAFVDALFQSKAIPCKANLLTRLADMDELQAESELAVYTLVDNVLYAEAPHLDERPTPRSADQHQHDQ